MCRRVWSWSGAWLGMTSGNWGFGLSFKEGRRGVRLEVWHGLAA